MATLQDTVAAVLAELQRRGENLQNTEIADKVGDFALVLGFKADGTFIRLPPELLQGNNTVYLTKEEYDELKEKGEIQEDVEYNIYEDE